MESAYMIDKIKALYKKHREIVDYIFFGGLTTFISIAVHYALIFFWSASTETATTISWVFAATFAFFVNKIFVFKSVSKKKSEWLKHALAFYGARLTTYFLELGFMILTVDIIFKEYPIMEYIMKIVAQVFVLITNYLLSKFWIFRKKSK
jgi:putative flippase GtrA